MAKKILERGLPMWRHKSRFVISENPQLYLDKSGEYFLCLNDYEIKVSDLEKLPKEGEK